MLQLALLFLIIALIAGALGVFEVVGFAMNVAYIFVVLFVVFLIINLVMGSRRPVP